MADTTDFTSGSTAALACGVRRRIRRYGPLEEQTVMFTEQKIADGGYSGVVDGDGDIMQLIDLNKGDAYLGGYIIVHTPPAAEVDAAVGGVGAAATEVSDLDTYSEGTVAALPATASGTALTAADTFDFDLEDANAFGEDGGAGVYQITVYILRGGEVAETGYNMFVGGYASDPNLPPQT